MHGEWCIVTDGARWYYPLMDWRDDRWSRLIFSLFAASIHHFANPLLLVDETSWHLVSTENSFFFVVFNVFWEIGDIVFSFVCLFGNLDVCRLPPGRGDPLLADPIPFSVNMISFRWIWFCLGISIPCGWIRSPIVESDPFTMNLIPFRRIPSAFGKSYPLSVNLVDSLSLDSIPYRWIGFRYDESVPLSVNLMPFRQIPSPFGESHLLSVNFMIF